jgi:hypothetical protein
MVVINYSVKLHVILQRESISPNDICKIKIKRKMINYKLIELAYLNKLQAINLWGQKCYQTCIFHLKYKTLKIWHGPNQTSLYLVPTNISRSF